MKFVTSATRPTGWWLSCDEVFLSFRHGRLLLDRVPALPSLTPLHKIRWYVYGKRPFAGPEGYWSDVIALFSDKTVQNGRRVSVHWFAGVLQSFFPFKCSSLKPISNRDADELSRAVAVPAWWGRE
jgi:hypothetical protein